MLDNLDRKTYRIETIVTEKKTANYFIHKSYVRNVEVFYLGKEEENEYYIFQLLVVEFDFSEDDNAMGKLIKQISYLFDELELEVNNEGIIMRVVNINSLRLRWTAIQTKLSEKHKGYEIERYFSQISKLLENGDKLIDFLEEYNMFGLLFHGLWNSFGEKRKRFSEKNNITETMTFKKVGNKLIQNILPESLEKTEILSFRGFYQYKENIYEEGYIEVENNINYFKYSLLWIT